jgi:tripartite-type tricarboxylate transporter receptor subunit TctC
MKRQRMCLLAVGVVLSVLLSLGESPAAPYFEGKVMKIIVGSEPGGGYDRMARLIAKHLPKHIPGKPTIIVENMPGAGSIIAANYVFGMAKPDGLTLGAPQRGIPFAQLTKAEGVKFDVTKYAWIGSPSVEATVFCVRTDLPFKTLDDLRKWKEPIPVAAAGPGTTDTQYPFLLKEFLGLNLKNVVYPSATAGTLAIERKEADGKAGSYSTLKQYIDRGLVRLIIRGRVSESGIESLPVDEEVTTDKTGKKIMAMRSAGDLIGRPYLAPPGTPPEVMTILRDAFAMATKDTELREEAKKLQFNIEHVSAEECLKVLNDALSQPEDVVREFSKYIKF